MPRNKQNACKYEVWSFHQGRLDELKGDTAENLFEAVCNKRLDSEEEEELVLLSDSEDEFEHLRFNEDLADKDGFDLCW